MYVDESGDSGVSIHSSPHFILSGLIIDQDDWSLNLERLKTGTPPRIHKDSVNYNEMEEQAGETPPPLFSRYAKQIRDNKIKDKLRIFNNGQ